MATISDQTTARDEKAPNDPTVPFKVGDNEPQGSDVVRTDKAPLPTPHTSETRSGADLGIRGDANPNAPSGSEGTGGGGKAGAYVPERLDGNVADSAERSLLRNEEGGGV